MKPHALKGLCIVAILMGMAGTALAQGASQLTPATSQSKTPKQIEEEKQLERRYQESLKRIPDKVVTDPWSNVRASDADAAVVKPVKPKPAPKPAAKGTTAAATAPRPVATPQ
ncbi:MAG: hypothetical protein ACLP8B_19435 [Xanthobacteraceae bacterium]